MSLALTLAGASMHCKPENYKDSRVQSHPAWINRFPGKRISKKEREEDKEEKTQEKKSTTVSMERFAMRPDHSVCLVDQQSASS